MELIPTSSIGVLEAPRAAVKLASSVQRIDELQASSLSFKNNIQYLRGFAAVAVMLNHTGYYFNDFFKNDVLRPYFPDMFGLYGVAIFFAISGYLMAELVEKQSPFEFITRRVFRIYPTFVLATVIGLLVIPDGFMREYLPITISLAPVGDVSYPLRIEWTLVNEMFFYVLLFGLAVVRLTKFIVPLAIIWIASIMLDAATSTEFVRIGKATLSEMPLMLANVGFAAGLLVPTLAKRMRQPALMVAAFVASIVVANLVPAPFVRITCGIGSGCLVLAAVQARFRTPRFLHRLLNALGDWSYSLYLIHVTVIAVCFTYLGPLLIDSVLLPLTVLGAIAAAAALGKADMLMHQRARQLSTEMPRSALVAFAWAFVSVFLAISLWIEATT